MQAWKLLIKIVTFIQEKYGLESFLEKINPFAK